MKKKQLVKQLAEARTELDEQKRLNRVMQVEIDSLAAVIARDRSRVLAESAENAARIAAAEGKK